jgi:hypothetical protein
MDNCVRRGYKQCEYWWCHQPLSRATICHATGPSGSVASSEVLLPAWAGFCQFLEKICLTRGLRYIGVSGLFQSHNTKYLIIRYKLGLIYWGIRYRFFLLDLFKMLIRVQRIKIGQKLRRIPCSKWHTWKRQCNYLNADYFYFIRLSPRTGRSTGWPTSTHRGSFEDRVRVFENPSMWCYFRFVTLLSDRHRVSASCTNIR